MIDSHPAIHSSMKETNAFLAEDWRETALGKLDDLLIEAERVGKARICEKTPGHVRKIKQIHKLLPASKFIFIVRDGRDVALSYERRIGDIRYGIKRWNEQNRIGLKAIRDGFPILQIKYEDLVSETEQVLTRACTFLGERFDPAMLQYYRTERHWFGQETAEPAVVRSWKETGDMELTQRMHRKNRNWQINQPIFPTSRWRDLDQERIDFLNEEMNELLTHFGYQS